MPTAGQLQLPFTYDTSRCHSTQRSQQGATLMLQSSRNETRPTTCMSTASCSTRTESKSEPPHGQF